MSRADEALSHALDLHLSVFGQTRGRYLSGHVGEWIPVIDAYEVAADALQEESRTRQANAAQRWARDVADAVARARQPRFRSMCSPRWMTWWFDRHGRLRTRDMYSYDSELSLLYEILGERSNGYDAMKDGWGIFVADEGPEIERDDEAGLLVYDDHAVPIAVAKLVSLLGCDLVRWSTR